MRVRLGTRRSRLALIQSEWVAGEIRRSFPNISVDFVEIDTTGDRRPNEALGPETGSAFFTKEIEAALLERRIDLAVHSCKDLATTLPDGLIIAAMPVREDPADALIGRLNSSVDSSMHMRIGTSSPRRRGFLAHEFPNATFHDQRGNVPTRIDAVDRGEFDLTVLAVAGLNRLRLGGRITRALPTEVILPAPGQGALAVQVRCEDQRVADIVRVVDHRETRLAVEAERACLSTLEAGCLAPVGAHGQVVGGEITLDVGVVTEMEIIRVQRTGDLGDGEKVGRALAGEILNRLGVSTLRGFLDWGT